MNFRQRLRQGDLLLGQMVLELFTPGIGPMLASCGLDFVIFDMEHGRCDLALLAEMVASCRGSDIVPIARVPDAAYVPLSRALDLGARGIMVPRVESRAQAEDIVSQLKYAPQGRRGVALGIAHDLYRAGNADFFARANEEICVILLLETARLFRIWKRSSPCLAWTSPGWGITISPSRWASRHNLNTRDFWLRWTNWSRFAGAMAWPLDSCRIRHSRPCIGSTKVFARSAWAVILVCSSKECATFARTS